MIGTLDLFLAMIYAVQMVTGWAYGAYWIYFVSWACLPPC